MTSSTRALTYICGGRDHNINNYSVAADCTRPITEQLPTTTMRLFAVLVLLPTAVAFCVQQRRPARSSRLYAIGALVKKAKQAELRNYVNNGIPEDVQ